MHARGPQTALILTALALATACPQALGQFNSNSKKKTEPERKELREFRDEADAVLAPISGGAAPGQPAASAEHWSIVLAAFRGPGQAKTAAEWLQKTRTEGGLPQAYLEKRDQATVIAYGRYASADDPRALADLERIRALESGGGKMYIGAILTPPAPQHLAGSLPDLDLRNAKKIHGKNNALYTLQVAIYGRADRSAAGPDEIAEYRRAAEQAAVILRRDGELAFYYHAPERSMVTVGVFGQADYDPVARPGIESLTLMQARERHPLNLLNGQGIRERIIGAQADGPQYRMQPSMLVGVPGS